MEVPYTHDYEESKAAFGVFRGRNEVSAAQSALVTNGFSRADISVMYPPRRERKDFLQLQKNSIRSGAFIGAAIGALVFLVVFIPMGMQTTYFNVAANSMMVSEQVLLVIGGLLGSVIFGAASGALVGIGTPQVASKRYGDYVDLGGILMSVHVNNSLEADRAKQVLEQNGAQDITLLKEGQSWETVYTSLSSHKTSEYNA